MQGDDGGGGAAAAAVPVHADPTEQAESQQRQDSLARRRAQLLAAKNIEVQNQHHAGGHIPFKERLRRELERFLSGEAESHEMKNQIVGGGKIMMTTLFWPSSGWLIQVFLLHLPHLRGSSTWMD